MARRDSAGVRLITRHGNDFTARFPLVVVVVAVTALPAHSFLLDGEAIVTNGDGLAVFDLDRERARHQRAVDRFDLIVLHGEDSPVRHSVVQCQHVVLADPSRHCAQRALRRRRRNRVCPRV